MKKVLYIFRGENASGAEIVIERLMSYNKEKLPYLLIAPSSFADQLRNGTPSYSISTANELKKLNRSTSPFFVFYFRAIVNYITLSFFTYKIIKKNHIDIVHANTIGTASYMLPLIVYCKIFNYKIKWIWSDHDLKYYSKIDDLMSKFCCFWYDVTLVVSNAVKAKHGKRKDVFVLYNGLDTSIYHANLCIRKKYRKEFEINEDVVVLGIPGVIAPRKGQVELIECFNQIKVKKNVILLIAGKFSEDYHNYELQLRALIKNISNVRYVGTIIDMVGFYNACDIIINNSNNLGSEPLGTTIYEGMSCQKVVVASNTGGTPEIIDNEINGILFEAENPIQLSNVLQEVINRYAYLNEVRANARQKVINKFNIEIMCKSYNEILSNL